MKRLRHVLASTAAIGAIILSAVIAPGVASAAEGDIIAGSVSVSQTSITVKPAALVRTLAWQLAAVASKAPAAEGRTAPESGLPWTAESLAGTISETAVCS